MPGFVICGTGADAQASVSGTVETRRKYRWVLRVNSMTDRAWVYLKSANRPKLTLGTIEQHHNQEKIWHEGKTTWNDLTCSFYDVEQPDVSASIYSWLATTTYDITNANARNPSLYKKDVNVEMYAAGGEGPTENWKYCNAWPFDVDWGNLDYTAEELCEIAVVFKYDRAQKV